MRFAIVPAILALAAVLAGCAASAPPELATRHTPTDSALHLTVDRASEGFTYGDLLVIVNNVPYKLGARMDADQRLFEVAGKDNPTDLVALGDIIRVPFAGVASVELRHSGGTSLQQLDLTIEDHTAPPVPVATLPQRDASGVSRQPLLQWTGVTDVSGVTYHLEYWLATQNVNAPHASIPAIPGLSYSVPSDKELLPSASYRWHVRAVDGAGNVGDWSPEAQFTTSV